MNNSRTSVRLFRMRSVAFALAFALVLVALAGTSVSARADTAAQGGLFHALTQRVLDTRNGTGGQPVAKFAANSWHSIVIDGQGSIPSSNISAVQVTFTVLNQAASGHLYADRTGVTPNTSVFYVSYNGSTTSNTAIIPVGADGKIQVMSSAQADVIIDVQGYFTGGNTAGGGFVPLSATQIYNSGSTQYGAGQSVTFPVAGANSVPSNASSVVLDIIEANGGSSAGFLTAYPAGSTKPSASLNWPAGRNFEWTTAVPLNSSGNVTITIGAGSGSVNLSVGVEGYFTAQDGTTSAGEFTQTTTQVYDSVSPSNPIPSQASRTISVAGVGGLPAAGSGISAVSANVEILAGSGATGNVSIYSDDESGSQATQQYYSGNVTTAFLTVPLGSDGGVTIQNSSGGNINVVVTVEGWYSAVTPTISCPDPYSNHSWGQAATGADITCTVSTPPTLAASDSADIDTDGSDQPIQTGAAAATTSTVDLIATPGEHTITATSYIGANQLETDYVFTLGDWTQGNLQPSPSDGETTSLNPTFAVSPDDSSYLPSDATFTFSIWSSSDTTQTPLITSPATDSTWTAPSGTFQDGSTYWVQPTVTAATGYDGSMATMPLAVTSFTTSASVADTPADSGDGTASSDPGYQIVTHPAYQPNDTTQYDAPIYSTKVVDVTHVSSTWTNKSKTGVVGVFHNGGPAGSQSIPGSVAAGRSATTTIETRYGISVYGVDEALGISTSYNVTVTVSCGPVNIAPGYTLYGFAAGNHWTYKIQQTVSDRFHYHPSKTFTSPLLSAFKASSKLLVCGVYKGYPYGSGA